METDTTAPPTSPRSASIGRATLEAAGLPYQKLHSLRHTFCTLALASGYTAQETAAACGHSSIAQILKTYAPPRGPESASKLEAYLSGGHTTAG
ncbi:MAG: hypothetical protein WA005_14950 [Candidatus Binataceae bacterium]